MTQITAQLTSRGDTSANWIAADPEIAAKEIVFTTDVFYTGTDQMKFKVGDGVQTWSQLDYMPIGTSTTPTLAQVLAQGATTSGNNITISAGDYITSTQYYLNGSKFLYTPNAGNNNIGLGGNTFNLTTTSTDSIGIGMNVMKDITTGFENIGIGVNSMFALTTGSNDVAVGHNTMLNVTTATECTAVGDDAMYANISGNQLSAFGAQALKNATGGLNSGFGYFSGVNISSGTGHTMIGALSGQGVTTGTNCVFIGYNTTGAAALTNGIGIGYNVTVTQDNSMILGNGVDVGIGTSTPARKLDVVGTGRFSSTLTLSSLTANRVPYIDASTNIVTSAVTDTELGYLSGVTSAIQTQINALQTGQFWKAACRVATTAAGTLATDFENGDTIDGVVLATGDRILIKDQAAPDENGIYVVPASGAPTRATDFDAGADNLSGATVTIQEGTANAEKKFTCSTNNPITIGVTNITFIDAGGVAYLGTSNRIDVTGNVIDISASYVGQASITTLGTIGTGTWQGTSISTTYTDAKIKGSVAATAGLIPYGTGTADTLTTSANLKYTAAAFTVATTLAATGIGNTFTVTGNNINPSLAEGLRVSLTAGFTNAGTTIGAEVYNASAGTGTNLKLATSFSNALGNAGVNAFAHATTTGYNIGGYYEALGGNINVGAIGKAITAKNSATNVGVIGIGLNTGSSPVQVGGYFGLGGSDTPTFTSSALMCDNGATTSNIFTARDNGTIVATIADGGAFSSVTVKATQAAGFISSDGSTGATGSFTAQSGETVTVKDGIITSIV